MTLWVLCRGRSMGDWRHWFVRPASPTLAVRQCTDAQHGGGAGAVHHMSWPGLGQSHINPPSRIESHPH
jgi:hypothetical protein